MFYRPGEMDIRDMDGLGDYRLFTWENVGLNITERDPWCSAMS